MYKRLIIITFCLAYLLTTMIGCMVSSIYALERCKQYIPEIRKWNAHYWCLQFPYHYAVGQAQQESNCRADVTAFDAGQGLFQFMPATEKYVESYLGKLDIYNPSHAIRANAWYMRQLHKQNFDFNKPLFLTYMFYNGGIIIVKKEYDKSGGFPACYKNMKEVCKRKKLVLKNSKLLDLCVVAYDYPFKIFTYGKLYETFSNNSWRYW